MKKNFFAEKTMTRLLGLDDGLHILMGEGLDQTRVYYKGEEIPVSSWGMEVDRGYIVGIELKMRFDRGIIKGKLKPTKIGR